METRVVTRAQQVAATEAYKAGKLAPSQESGAAMPVPEYDGEAHHAPWYVDCAAPYTGSAAPIGQKAHFWRQYFYTNLHERIQYRSLMDHILRDFAEVERRYLEERNEAC